MEIVTFPADPVGAGAAAAAWQQAMKGAVRDPRELCRLLGLPAEYERAADEAARQFGLFVPRAYLAKMRPGDVHDPLLVQVLPLDRELADQVGFSADAVGERAAQLRPGLLQKYAGRVLLITTGACAVHCRYCFRRHFPYDQSPPSPAVWQTAVDRLAQDETIEEVLLSGGDPLTLADASLAQLARRLAEVPHLRRLRLHTRLPIVIPERVTDELLGWLRETRLVPTVVVHANHPREIDSSVGGALERLVDAGIPVLNQSVLLAGVNDDAETLAQLSRALIQRRVLPYYLHQLDRVAGAAHFEVPLERGRELVRQLRRQLPGYAVPRYVQELPGEPHKVVLDGG